MVDRPQANLTEFGKFSTFQGKGTMFYEHPEPVLRNFESCVMVLGLQPARSK